ncbi:TonB-dependent receptor [Pseudoflavitalea sp. G-6-1-2]|uniref:TonB-dependent receptor n=1 Tax=Pseudoflavitalea sp. G-6-1-2 TaxID=2728841 RepID=UPI00146F184F|nr:TonB-dependent receptor [Pseudoflavitalea sp. G-6-1-2]NML19892.1 TonB-dependent receptor [Pseudoflavitalea sp. G-6-1-2]
MIRSTIRILSVILILLTTVLGGFAQPSKKFTISGYVKDASNGEVLINATINVNPGNATVQTNGYGFFSISLPAGKYTLTTTYAGFAVITKEIDLNDNQALDLQMKSSAGNLDEVVVTGERRLRRTNTVALGIQQMSIGQIKKIPAFLGEPDVLKAMLTLPGITSVGEGANGFNVRGGNVDENLIIMDEAPVYNSSHMLGFFSVFNPDAVKNVTLYKGAFPSEFGGRTSSVLDIRMKDGNNQKLSVNGGISSIFSRISIEGPLKKDKSSFIIAGRRSYIDILSKPARKKEERDNKFYFYDLTAKGNWQLDDKNTLYLSGYYGRDVFGTKQANMDWGNMTTTLRWNHLFTPKLFLNTSVYYSKYDYSLKFNTEAKDTKQQSYSWKSDIQTYGIKPSLTWYVSSKHQLKTGLSFTMYNFFPGKGIMDDDGNKAQINLVRRYGAEAAAYLEDTWKVSKALTVQAGVRMNYYAYLSNSSVYHFRDTVANTRKPLAYEEIVGDGSGKKKKVADWTYLEPRVSIRYELKKNTYLKAGYARSSQFMHLLSNTASPTPVDLYFPSTNNINPSVTDQVSVGVVSVPEFLNVELSAEVFYKRMSNVLDYIDNSRLDLNPQVEADLLTGKGKSYGVELEVKKETGKWQGWINYTWSRSYRKTEGISNNDWFLNRYDRTHVLNLAVTRELNTKWSVSANFNYGSGTPATYPNVKLDIQGIPIPYNTDGKRNNFRLPAYHRLDIAATMKGRQGKRMKQEWVFGIYNVYARQNAYTIYFRQNEDDAAKREAVRLSILGSIIPSITWNFKF